MNTNEQPAGDERLQILLRGARPTGELRPGFERQVWQRIERADRKPSGVMDWLAALVSNPRFAAGALAAVVVLSGAAGAVRGVQAGDEAARHRYLAAVDPNHFGH